MGLGPRPWTLVFPDTRVELIQAYVRMLHRTFGESHPLRYHALDNTRPLLSKVRHLGFFRTLATQEGPFHLEQCYLTNMAVVRLRRCLATVWDLYHAFYPTQHPVTLPERIDARASLVGARRADALVAISEFQRRELAARLPFDIDRIFTAHLAIDHSVFTPGSPKERDGARAALLRHYGLEGHEGLLLSMSGWQPRKNIPAMLRTLRLLLDRGRDVRLLMRRHASRDRWNAPIEGLLTELALQRHVLWTPPLDEPLRVQHLRGVDALLFPSYYEGFGLPPLEAMACACPVVGSNVSTMPEVVGSAGMLSAPDDHDAMADDVERLLDDPGLRESITRTGLVQARRFTWDAAADAHRAAYERVARS